MEILVAKGLIVLLVAFLAMRGEDPSLNTIPENHSPNETCAAQLRNIDKVCDLQLIQRAD